MKRRRGAFLAVFLWVCVIWGHSLVQGGASSTESGIFVTLLRPVFEALGISNQTTMSFIVRKCGHFSEYLVLGLLVHHAVRPDWSHMSSRIAGMLLFILVIPCLDETIQIFVPGRNSAVRDVFIDLAGAATGLLIVALVRRHKEKAHS
ncbi:MAG: VanZ family protein [Atopobiaceae bacterium]